MQPFKAICLAAAVDAIQLNENKESSLTAIMAEGQHEPYVGWWEPNEPVDVYTEAEREANTVEALAAAAAKAEAQEEFDATVSENIEAIIELHGLVMSAETPVAGEGTPALSEMIGHLINDLEGHYNDAEKLWESMPLSIGIYDFVVGEDSINSVQLLLNEMSEKISGFSAEKEAALVAEALELRENEARLEFDRIVNLTM
jgi:hypothetical protein